METSGNEGNLMWRLVFNWERRSDDACGGNLMSQLIICDGVMTFVEKTVLEMHSDKERV